MTLFDCSANSGGRIISIGCESSTHRRLVDMGLLDSECVVRAKRKSAVLADFGGLFTAVVERGTAEQIEVGR